MTDLTTSQIAALQAIKHSSAIPIPSPQNQLIFKLLRQFSILVAANFKLQSIPGLTARDPKIFINFMRQHFPDELEELTANDDSQKSPCYQALLHLKAQLNRQIQLGSIYSYFNSVATNRLSLQQFKAKTTSLNKSLGALRNLAMISSNSQELDKNMDATEKAEDAHQATIAKLKTIERRLQIHLIECLLTHSEATIQTVIRKIILSHPSWSIGDYATIILETKIPIKVILAKKLFALSYQDGSFSPEDALVLAQTYVLCKKIKLPLDTILDIFNPRLFCQITTQSLRATRSDSLTTLHALFLDLPKVLQATLPTKIFTQTYLGKDTTPQNSILLMRLMLLLKQLNKPANEIYARFTDSVIVNLLLQTLSDTQAGFSPTIAEFLNALPTTTQLRLLPNKLNQALSSRSAWLQSLKKLIITTEPDDIKRLVAETKSTVQTLFAGVLQTQQLATLVNIVQQIAILTTQQQNLVDPSMRHLIVKAAKDAIHTTWQQQQNLFEGERWQQMFAMWQESSELLYELEPTAPLYRAAQCYRDAMTLFTNACNIHEEPDTTRCGLTRASCREHFQATIPQIQLADALQQIEIITATIARETASNMQILAKTLTTIKAKYQAIFINPGAIAQIANATLAQEYAKAIKEAFQAPISGWQRFLLGELTRQLTKIDQLEMHAEKNEVKIG